LVLGAPSTFPHWVLLLKEIIDPSLPVKAGLKTLKLVLLKIKLASWDLISLNTEKKTIIRRLKSCFLNII
tara:strand:- start:232 stop:441 length:210 start_codon:yes stop_codon:yes gene_type:complete